MTYENFEITLGHISIQQRNLNFTLILVMLCCQIKIQ